METEIMVSKKAMAISIAVLSAVLLIGVGASKYEQYKDSLTSNRIVNTREYNKLEAKRITK